MQASHAAGPTNLAAVAKGCGIPVTLEVTDAEGIARLGQLVAGSNDTIFARVAIAATEHPRVLPLRDGAALKIRFRRALGLDR
jgi:hypothetical protein